MSEQAAGIIQSLGYIGVALLLALDECFPPLPADLLLPFIGFLAASGRMSLPAIVLAATTGSVAGQMLVYLLARWRDAPWARSSLARRATVMLSLDSADLERARVWFDRHGAAAVFFARLLPLGSLIAIPAGLAPMPARRFALYTLLGSALWDGALIVLGWGLGERWGRVVQLQLLIQLGALAILVAAAIWVLTRRSRAAKR